MIHLTETAASAMRDAISSAGVQGLRLGVQPGGCAGMKIPHGPGEDRPARRHRRGAARRSAVRANPRMRRSLNGLTVDFVTDAGGAGFTFDNPNAQRCGCGKSFC